MPKDTSSVVLGMLSAAGSRTKPAPQPAEQPSPAPALSTAAQTAPPATASPTPPPENPTTTRNAPKTPPATQHTAPGAPRTLRLRAATAARLRTAWMDAKRDDVLLTAQDFASNLVDDALTSRRRTQRRS
jgi:hypothetical protein